MNESRVIKTMMNEYMAIVVQLTSDNQVTMEKNDQNKKNKKQNKQTTHLV